MKRLILIYLVIGVGAPVFAQDTVKVAPGGAIIDGSFIEPYTNKWEVYVQTPDDQENHIRYWTDYVHIIDQDGTPLMHRVQDIYGADRSLQSTWVNVVEHESLIPKRFTVQGPTGAIVFIDFDKERVISGSNQNEAGTFSSDTLATDQFYYDWNLYGMLLVGLPFNEGTTYELPYWNTQNNVPTSVFASIGEEEETETMSGKKIMTNPVSTSDGFTFSLSKKAPYVIKLVWDLPNGNKMIWRKI